MFPQRKPRRVNRHKPRDSRRRRSARSSVSPAWRATNSASPVVSASSFPPPLRQRRQDIPQLAEHFLKQASREMNREVSRFADGVMAALESHGWPGNVRELKHVIEAGVALSRGEALGLEDLDHSGFVPDQATEASDTEDGLTSLERLERDQILRALKESSWVQKRAVDALGISGRVIHYKIRKYGIEIPRP